jgi:cytochrome c5
MARPTRLLALALLAALAATGCGEQDVQTGAPSTELPTFDDDRLMAGRTLWIGTCRACHLLGVAGAPPLTAFAEWDLRLAKGRDALYTSALHGIPADEAGKYRMPPQGGNPRLSADQVRLAVDYKLAAIEALRAASQGKP